MIEKNCVEAQLALCRLLIDEQHEGRVKIKFVYFFFLNGMIFCLFMSLRSFKANHKGE